MEYKDIRDDKDISTDKDMCEYLHQMTMARAKQHWFCKEIIISTPGCGENTCTEHAIASCLLEGISGAQNSQCETQTR